MLINLENSCVVITNVQKGLIPFLHEPQKLVDNCCWLIDVAQTLNVPVLIFEHKRLEETATAIKQLTKPGTTYVEKIQLSCVNDDNAMSAINQLNKSQIIFAGTEAHITILQSAIGLTKLGKEVFVVADAISARSKMDIDFAVLRMQQAGVPLITREMLFFEWIEYSEYPNYINMSLKFLDNRYTRM